MQKDFVTSTTKKNYRMKTVCPICANTTGSILGKLSFALPASYPISAKLSVIACNNCGHVTSQTSSSQKDYNTYYSTFKYSPAHKTTEISIAGKEYFSRITAILEKYLHSHTDTIIDIGSGLSILPQILYEKGYTNTSALDLSADCISVLTRSRDHHAYIGSITELNRLKLNPSITILLHILEHFTEPQTELTTLYQKLADKTKIYIEVPNTAQLPQFEKNPLEALYYTHLSHFDSIHLKMLLEKNGFRQITGGEHIRPENNLHIPAIWAVFEKCPHLKPKFTPDFSLAEKISSWFSTSENNYPELTRLANSKSPVYVWGIGMHAHYALEMTPLKNANIKALVDGNKDLYNQKIKNWTINSSSLLKTATTDETVFITARTHIAKMIKILREDFNFTGKIITL